MPVHKSSYMLLLAVFLIIITGCYREPAPPAPADTEPEIRLEIPPDAPDKAEEPPDVDEPQPEAVDAEETVFSITPDFSADILEKKQRNADTVGWLHIPGTEIDQVVLHKPEVEDNNYYLNLSFEGLPDKNGTFCADFRDRFGPGGRGDMSRVTAIYGHSWDDDPNGELFAQLKKFRDPEFAEDHPYIFFSTESENMVWEVFAVFETTVYLPYIDPDLPDDMFGRMLNIVLASSLYDYEVTVGREDKLLTLSTCVFSVEGHEALPEYNDYRFAVMARLVGPDEKIKETSGLSVSEMVLEPDATLALRSLYTL